MKSRRVFVEQEMQFNHCFGEVLRAARKERQWTQIELASRVDASPASLSRWETGETSPPLNLVVEMAEALEVPLVVLVERAVVMWEALEEAS